VLFLKGGVLIVAVARCQVSRCMPPAPAPGLSREVAGEERDGTGSTISKVEENIAGSLSLQGLEITLIPDFSFVSQHVLTSLESYPNN
jgi:hypothetical protein